MFRGLFVNKHRLCKQTSLAFFTWNLSLVIVLRLGVYTRNYESSGSSEYEFIGLEATSKFDDFTDLM